MKKLFLLSLALMVSFSLCWGTAHTITPNKAGTNYEIYEIAHANNQSGTVIKTKASTFNSDFTSWCSGAIYDYASSIPTVPSGISANWLTPSTKGAKIRDTGITFEVTNCIGVAVLGKAAGSSGDAKKLTLSVKLAGEEVGTLASDWNTNVHELSYATSLSASNTYTITVASSGAQNSEFYQIRFEAPAASVYTVTYKAGEGTGDDVVDDDAKTVKTFATCGFTAPSGYEFKEWQDGSSNVVAEGATVSDNMTLTAIYRLIPTKYTVTYVLNGPSGDAPTETSKAAGDVFALAAAPSWAGHAFDGWLCSADAAVKAAGASYTMTAANTTFTAQWHEVDCKIYSFTGGIGAQTVQAAAATIDASSMVISDSKGIIKLTPAAGETFKAGDVITISGIIGNTAKTYGVKISASSGKGDELGTASVAGTTVPLVATTTLSADADYLYICRADGTTNTLLTCEVHRSCAEGTAAGLSYATAAVEKTMGDDAFTNSLTNTNGLVIAYYSSNTAVATVDANGQVTLVSDGEATITAYSAVQTQSGTLYAAGSASYTLTVNPAPTYTVTYAANGGEGTMTDSNSPYHAGDVVTLMENTFTAPSGYVWVSWSVKDAGDNTVAVSEGKFTMPSSNVTVTAQWQLDANFDVKFFQGYGEPDVQIGETQSISTGNYATAPTEDPERAGYVFLGWSYDATAAHIVDVASYAITAATNFTAIWNPIWTVTFDGAGNVNVENGKKVSSPNSPSQAGKVFQGWYNGEDKYDFSAAVTGDLALTSKWVAADADHYVYAYNDDFHYDGVVYKTPEGKIDNGDGNSNKAMTTPYTLFSGEGGITSVVMTDGIYDSKTGAIQAVTALMKVNNTETSKLTITIKAGYTATLKITAGGYSATRTMSVSDASPASITTTGQAVKDNKMNLSSLTEQTFNLTAGSHDLTVTGGTLYIARIDLQASEATAFDNTADEAKAVKRIENGMLIIEKNGIRYNAQGQVIR